MEKKNAVYTIMEEQSPEEARREHILLIARNFAAGAAAVLFLASFALADIHKLLRAAAYFLGAGAYFAASTRSTVKTRKMADSSSLPMVLKKNVPFRLEYGTVYHTLRKNKRMFSLFLPAQLTLEHFLL